jgi:hypothetical protein
MLHLNLQCCNPHFAPLLEKVLTLEVVVVAVDVNFVVVVVVVEGAVADAVIVVVDVDAVIVVVVCFEVLSSTEVEGLAGREVCS